MLIRRNRKYYINVDDVIRKRYTSPSAHQNKIGKIVECILHFPIDLKDDVIVTPIRNDGFIRYIEREDVYIVVYIVTIKENEDSIIEVISPLTPIVSDII